MREDVKAISPIMKIFFIALNLNKILNTIKFITFVRISTINENIALYCLMKLLSGIIKSLRSCINMIGYSFCMIKLLSFIVSTSFYESS